MHIQPIEVTTNQSAPCPGFSALYVLKKWLASFSFRKAPHLQTTGQQASNCEMETTEKKHWRFVWMWWITLFTEKKGGRGIEVVPLSFLCTITCNYVKHGTQNEPYQDRQSVLIPPFLVAANYILLRISYITKTLQAILANYL